MKHLFLLLVLVIFASCSQDSEQYCEIVDYKNSHLTNGWEEERRTPTTDYDEPTIIFNRAKDGSKHKRVVECYDAW